jgi:hypothetical protein
MRILRVIPSADDVMCTAYGTMAWCFAPAVIATNPARDLGKWFSALLLLYPD